MTIPKYTIIPVKKGYKIPDGSIVNELTFTYLYEDESYLDRIVSLGWAI